MEGGGEGMVAVVRGLRDSGLAVTLMDGARQYTLMPNSNSGNSQSPERCSSPNVRVTQCAHAPSQTQEPCAQSRDSAAQATDGRYASMYKLAHCRVTPTCPPVQLTEFPPQRAELCRGHGNFEVGGCGSGENYTSCRSSGSFRGAMSWPDRGSVCSPRPSREPDAFANSLRKYPSISVERSTELVERLITYTQAKNISKSYPSRYNSPSRHGTESNTSNQVAVDKNNYRNTVPRSGSYQKSYEPEVNITNKARPRMEESPTRDNRTECDCAEYRRQVTRAENKYYKDISRKAKENIRNVSTYPYNQPMLSPVTRDRYEPNILSGQKSPNLTAANSVDMEVQAAAEMVSKEIATVPRAERSQRSVAVPLSPVSSSDDQKPEGDVSDQRHAKLKPNPPTYKTVENTSNPADVANHNHNENYHCFENKRRTMLNDNLHMDFSEEIFELLENVSVNPNSDPQAYDLRRQVLKEMSIKLKNMVDSMNCKEEIDSIRDQIGQLLKYVPIWVPSGDVQAYRDAISDEIMSRMNRYRSIDVYRAETHYDISAEERNLEIVLNNWICYIPLKSFDVYGKRIEKDNVRKLFVNQLKRLILSKPNDGSYSLKTEIVNTLSNLPIADHEFVQPDYLKHVTELLLYNLKLNTIYLYTSELDSVNQKKRTINNRFVNYIQPIEEEMRACISDEVKQFLENNCSKTNSVEVREIELEIIDYLIDSIRAIRSGEDYVESELTMLLCQDIDNISWFDAKRLARKFLKLVKDMFSSNTNQESTQSFAYQQQTYVVQNAATCPNKSNQVGSPDASIFSIEAISKNDIDTNLDAYMNQLTAQIDEWLASLHMQIPQAHDSGFRQVVVHDLAGDIVDRHKYLEVNPSSRGTDSDELEHLKYQIFKWINKLAGEDNMDTIRHAPELMQRIQSIPVPMLAIPQQNSTGSGSNRTHRGPNVNSSMSSAENFPISMNKPRPSINQSQPLLNMSASCCSSTHLKPSTPSLKKLNDEYNEFLKKWVQEIPIPATTPAERAIADKARMGIYNGVWKAITKLKFEPATFNNQFYYEDALDDELEELLSALPKSPELDTKKHLLKVKLIERTTNTNELIKSTATPASFKQQLVENVSNSISRQTANKEEPKQLNEELQIQKLVEDYILCANFKDVDKAKANIYRKRLIQEAQTLVDNMKKTHGKELQDIDKDLYMTNIFNALHKVPLPDEETVKDEADEIMLGAEVEQWMLDIPVAPSNDGNEQLQRKKLKDALVKRIREIEKEVNIFDCTGERVFKHEISSFLENVPVKQGENLNITFMTEEFANRMKNRAKELQAGNATRKSVAFMDSVGYYEFSQHMPYCSSFSELPGARPAVANQSSYMIRDGTRVKDLYGYNYYTEASLPPHVPLPSEEYFTLVDSQATPEPKQPPIQAIQEQNQYSKIQSYKTIPPETLHGTMHESVIPDARSYHATARDRTVPPTHTPMPTQPSLNPLQDHNQYSKFQNYKTMLPETLHGMIHESVAPNAQSYHVTPRDRTVPPTQPERQSPFCRNVAENIPPQQTIQGVSQSGQRLSNARDQIPPAALPIPPQAQSPCCARDQNNTNRVGSTQQRVGTPMQTVAIPEGVTRTSQLPQVPHRSSIPPPPQPGSSQVIEQQQQAEAIRRASQTRGLPAQISTYGEPQWFSTPQQVITQGSPPKPGRKKARGSQRNRRNLERRRLQLEDDTEDNFESEDDEPCHCVDRMRCRRPPICFVYEDFDMDQCYPMPYGSFPLVTNNFTVQLCGDVRMGARSANQDIHYTEAHRNIKSVQTSFSSVDLASTEKCNNYNRKIKSQEDIRNKDRDIQLENEVLDWLKETFNGEVTSKWGEKMQRLAQKLKRPGGEEKIRQKIQKYLRRVPNPFSESDEERREFRDQLPDAIIKKLKKIYLKPERSRNYSSPVKIFRIEIPKEYYNVKDTYRSVVKNWMKGIPIKKRDFLGRGIRKEDVIESVIFQLEPYILNEEEFDKDYRSRLKATIMEILNEMPLEIYGFDKTSYCNILALSLLNDIIHLNKNEYNNETSNAEASNPEHEKELRQFISNQIANILNKLHLSASTKRLDLFEEELKDALETICTKVDNGSDATTKENVYTILHKVGGLSDYQANYFTDVILEHFKDFNEKLQDRISPDVSRDKSGNTEVPYNNIYSVFHNAADIKSNISNRKCIENTKDLTMNDEIKSNIVFYKRRLIVQIDDWLNELHVKIPFENREKAIRELAEDIIDRFKYLEINPISKGTDQNELQYFKYQIFKWINKVAGENTMETIIEHANELMEKIQSIETPSFVKSEEEKYKPLLQSKIKSIVNNSHSLRFDSKTEKIMIRKYEDIIDEWVDDFAKTYKESVNINDRNKHTHDFAMQIFNFINGEEKISRNCLENITLKWVEIFVDKQFFWRDCVPKLVDSVIKYNNEMLLELNQEKDNTGIFQINKEPNQIINSNNKANARQDEKIDIVVYGVTLPSNPKPGNTSIGDNSIKAINDDDVQAGLDSYLKQLVEQIDNWLGTLNIPQIHDEGFREIVINDLAGDIIDRHKYLELNPSKRGTDESELEQLKYQIFKWINKLVGEDQHETVEHASDLMNRIRSIPVPMLTKHSETCENRLNPVINRNLDRGMTKTNTSAEPSNVRLSSPLGFTTGPMATTNKQTVIQMPLLSPQARSSLPTKSNANIADKRMSGPPALGIPKTPTRNNLQTHSEVQENLPEGKSLEEVYQYYDIIFQERVKEIPLETPTPVQEALADLAKKGIYNGIWKTYFQLKADPEIENDYTYFEMVFEDQLDNMLDCLPQTSEIQKMRHAWKVKVLCDILAMLKYVHSISDSPSFRQMITERFKRQYLRARNLKESNLIQQQCIVNIARNYILQSKYKIEDPVKAEVYRQRLMKELEEFAESIKSQGNVDFKSINYAQFCQMAMKLLATVPIPHDETLNNEAEEILITEEIDQWYNGLPVKPARNETDVDLRKRMRELLAKKLYEIEKRVDLDESAEQDLKHEVSKFLQEKAELQPNADLQIEFMVEELTNRLKNRRQQNMLGYESFEKEKPMSSTFAQTDPGEVLASLVDAGVHMDGPNSYEYQEADFNRSSMSSQPQMIQTQGFGTSQAESNNQGHFYQGQMPSCCQNIQGQGVGPGQVGRPNEQASYQRRMSQTTPPGQGVLGTSQVAGPNQVPTQRRMSQVAPPCCQGQGFLGTSQVARPNSQDPFQRRMSQTPPPRDQGLGILDTSQVAGPQPIDQMPQPGSQVPGTLRASQITEPNQAFAPAERFGGRSYYEPSDRSDRIRHLPNTVPYANRPENMLDPGQAVTSSVPPSTSFLTTQDQTPTGARSTARVVSSVPEVMEEETDGEEEIRYKCQCMKRVWKCKKHRICKDMPVCFPMPFPCRYFY